MAKPKLRLRELSAEEEQAITRTDPVFLPIYSARFSYRVEPDVDELGARIAAVAHGGQVLLSASTRRFVAAEATDLGEHRLKDLAEAVHIVQLLGRRTYDASEDTVRNKCVQQLRESRADEETARWKNAGYTAEVVEREGWYCVAVGRYGTREEARSVAEKLKEGLEGGYWISSRP